MAFLPVGARGALCAMLAVYAVTASPILARDIPDTGAVAAAPDTAAHLAAHVDTTPLPVLEPLTVTSSRRQQLHEASHSLAIIRPDEWNGTTKSIADVIAEQTGVQTRRYGGLGSFQTVSVRGVPGSAVLVLLDGVPLNSAMGDAVDLGALNPARIGEIEVYKGITPAAFGGNSIGGVINLKSAAATRDTVMAAMQATAGAYGHQQFGLEAAAPAGNRTRMFGALQYLHAKNNWPYLDRNKTPYNLDDDRIARVENHHYRLFEARVHPAHDLAGGRTLNSGVSYSSSRIGIAAPEGSINRTAYHDRGIVQVTTRLAPGGSGDGAVVLTPSAGYVRWSDKTFWTHLDESMGSAHGGFGAGAAAWGESRSVFETVHATGVADLLFADWLGAQVACIGRHSQIVTTTRATGFPHGDWPGNSQEVSLGADVKAALPTGPLQPGALIGGGVKGVRSATRGGNNAVFETTVNPSDTIEFLWSARGGLQLVYEDMLSLYANAARQSATPSLRQRFGTGGAFIPNPRLVQESGVTVEGGARLLRERLFIEAAVYQTSSRNGIMLISDGAMSKPVNSAAARIRGVETTLWARPVSLVSMELRATLQEALNLTRFYNYDGKRLPNEPPLNARAGLTLGPLHGIEIAWWLDYTTAFFRDPGNVVRVPDDRGRSGELLHNVHIGWRAPRHVECAVSLRNINGRSLRHEALVGPPDVNYAWVLSPAHQWSVTVKGVF